MSPGVMIHAELDEARGETAVLEFARRFTHACEGCSFGSLPDTGAPPKHELRISLVKRDDAETAYAHYYIDGLEVEREDFETFARWLCWPR
jgi:hypothetical protein